MRIDTKIAAFTLAETLITLVIIGIIAAMTIPTLIKNYQQKSWTTSANVFEKRLNQALKIMNVEGNLAGKTNTKDFLNELGKNFKIAKICNIDELEQCFTTSISAEITDFDSSELQNVTTFLLSDIKSNDTLRNTSYQTGVKGVVFVNGVSALIEYNPDCKSDRYNNQFNGLDCLAILYDVNGNQNPNTIGKDIVSLKTKMNGGIKFGEKTWTEPKIANTPLSYDECLKTKNSLGIKNCHHDRDMNPTNDDYWGGAVKECKGTQNMPSQEDLTELAKALYDWDNMNHTNYSSSNIYSQIDTCKNNTNCLNIDKASKFLGDKDYFIIWSNTEPRRYVDAYKNYSTAETRSFNLNQSNHVEFTYSKSINTIYYMCKTE